MDVESEETEILHKATNFTDPEIPVLTFMKNNLKEVLQAYKNITHQLLDNNLQLKNDSKVDVEAIEHNLEKLKEKYVLVDKAALSRMQKEMTQLKDALPKMLTKDLLQMPLKLFEKEQECKKVNEEKVSLEREIQLIKKRYNSMLGELEQERQENADLRKQISSVTSMCSEQAEYCAKLGGATCALLWRVSQQDDIMQKMLNGDTGKDFLQLSAHTLDSYSLAIQESHTKVNSANNEYRFIVALIGVITNISASAYGREFLVTSNDGKELIDVMIVLFKQLSLKESLWMKLRNLILKTFYNISINQKGLKLLCSKKDLLIILPVTVENDRSSENRVQAIRLIQSIIYEGDCIEASHIIIEKLPIEKLRTMVQTSRGEVKSCIEELLTDLQLMEREQ